MKSSSPCWFQLKNHQKWHLFFQEKDDKLVAPMVYPQWKTGIKMGEKTSNPMKSPFITIESHWILIYKWMKWCSLNPNHQGTKMASTGPDLRMHQTWWGEASLYFLGKTLAVLNVLCTVLRSHMSIYVYTYTRIYTYIYICIHIYIYYVW